jgi:hypothetical protein
MLPEGMPTHKMQVHQEAYTWVRFLNVRHAQGLCRPQGERYQLHRNCMIWARVSHCCHMSPLHSQLMRTPCIRSWGYTTSLSLALAARALKKRLSFCREQEPDSAERYLAINKQWASH